MTCVVSHKLSLNPLKIMTTNTSYTSPQGGHTKQCRSMVQPRAAIHYETYLHEHLSDQVPCRLRSSPMETVLVVLRCWQASLQVETRLVTLTSAYNATCQRHHQVARDLQSQLHMPDDCQVSLKAQQAPLCTKCCFGFNNSLISTRC